MELKEGIIIKTINYKENSKIIYIVTEEGLCSLEVKGANKVNGHSHLYSNLLTNIAYSSRGHFFQAGKVLNNYINIRNNIDKLSFALNILELSYASIEHITDFKIFYNFLKEILNLLESQNLKSQNNDKFYYCVFNIKLLYLLGVQPVLKKCVRCGNTGKLYAFVLKDGGMKCINCINPNDKLIRDKELLNTIYKMYYLKLDVLKENIFEFDYKKTKAFFEEYYEEFLSYVSKSNKIFEKLNKI